MKIYSQVAALILFCLPVVGLQAAEVAESQAPALTKVKLDRLDEVYAKPGVDWHQYTHVLLAPLDMNDTEIKAPSGTHKRDIKPLTDKQKEAFNSAFQRAFTRELNEDDAFQAASEAQANTLKIQGKILQLAPTYIPDSRMAASGRNRVYSETAGTITMQFEIYDAVSGELLAKVTDKREATRMWRENNAVQNRAQVNQIMGSWARIFRNHLDDVSAR